MKDYGDERIKRMLEHRPVAPKRAVLTGGMPYGNKNLHYGHVLGMFLYADFMARFLRDRIGKAAKTKEDIGANLNREDIVVKEEMPVEPEEVKADESKTEEVTETVDEAKTAEKVEETNKAEKVEETAKEDSKKED